MQAIRFVPQASSSHKYHHERHKFCGNHDENIVTLSEQGIRFTFDTIESHKLNSECQTHRVHKPKIFSPCSLFAFVKHMSVVLLGCRQAAQRRALVIPYKQFVLCVENLLSKGSWLLRDGVHVGKLELNISANCVRSHNECCGGG